MLYPMKFMPLFKNKVWGGNKIKSLGFDYDPLPNCGELWALSSVEGNESIITNGFLADNTLNEVLEIYMGELVGERNFERFGTQFPLLIKLIDAADKLSIQVHPDDALAQSRGMENGKTEMWYILEAEQGAQIIDGFNRPLSVEEYELYLQNGKLEQLLHVEYPDSGDAFFIPAGRVHALGKGILLAEIQQTSDCTYRLYDYNRPDTNGKLRELHTAEALAAIDFSELKDGKTHYTYRENATQQLANCPYFTTNLVQLTPPDAQHPSNPTAIRKDFHDLDSFVVYFCVEGIAAVKCLEKICPIHVGECVLVPAVADSVELFSEGPAKLLEIYIDPSTYAGMELPHKNDFDWFAQFVGADPDDCCCDDDCDCHHDDDCDCDDCHDHDCHCEDDDCHCHHDHDCHCGHHHE